MSGRHEEIIDEDTVESLKVPVKKQAASVRKESLKESEDDLNTEEEDFEINQEAEAPPVKLSRLKSPPVKPSQDDFSREDEAVAPKRKNRKNASNGAILMIVITVGLFLAGSLVVGKYIISSSDQIVQPIQSIAAPPPQLPSLPIPKPVVVAAQTPETSTLINKALDEDKKSDSLKPSDLATPVIPESSNKVDLVENTSSNLSTNNNRSLADTLRTPDNLGLPLNPVESRVVKKDSCAVILSE